MDKETAKSLSYDEMRTAFRTFLFNQGKKVNTVNTMTNEVFFLWRKCGAATFWKAVEADEAARRELVLDAINRYSTPGLASYISGFMTSYRRFLEFIGESDVSQPVVSHTVKQKSLPHIEAEKISAQEIERVHKMVVGSRDYGTDYQMISRAFNKFPLNNDPEIVAMKIALIDMTNSTHLGVHRSKISTSELVQVILDISDFDDRVRQGDPDLVNMIARNTGNINLFSFATKYCTYHNVDIYRQDAYSIYDSVVAKTLPRYALGVTAAEISRWRTGFDYKSFSDCICSILDQNEIYIEFRRRKFDHYIWYTNR